ncbi:MAG: Methyltransferase [Pseudonocardiales bacterium]|nr:Methyltransferase [Pseudonocardiales bacterium]
MHESAPTPGSGLRIVGGTARGRRIAVPPTGTRPTSERAREALFNRLDTLLDIDGSRVLDLYAGSGAVGLEALSRGAVLARFVENDRKAADMIRANIATVLGRQNPVVGARTAVDVRPVQSVLAAVAPDSPFDVVFADPPYALDGADIDTMVQIVTRTEWLVEGGVIIVERAARSEALKWPERIEPLAAKRYGEGVLWYGRSTGPAIG